MKANPVGWFDIYVHDMSRAQKVYEPVLAGQLKKPGDPNDDGIQMMAFPMDMGRSGESGALVKIDGFPSGGSSTLVYFSCADCADEVGRVISACGRIQREKMAIGEYGFVVLAYDTEGNMFGLHSMN